MTANQASRTKLLLINFGGIGDEILFLPTISSIRAQHPDWHISLLVEPRSKSVAQITNLTDAIITFDIKKKPLLACDLLDLLGLIRNGNYDLVLSSGSSPMVSMLLFLSGIRQRIGYNSGWPFAHLLTRAVSLKQNQYAAYMYHDLVQGLDITAAASWPEIKIAAKNRRQIQEFLEQKLSSPAQEFVLLHPGVSNLSAEKGIIKNWPASCWVELISNLQKAGHQVVLSGGPDDSRIIAEIQSLLGDTADSARVISAYGASKSLADLAALIDASRLFICLDSAPMHIAVSLKKHLVALFGPTEPSKLLPYDPRFTALKDTGASKNSALPYGIDIKVDDVFQAALKQLS